MLEKSNAIAVAGEPGAEGGRLLRRLGLHRVTVDQLTIRRVRQSRGFAYHAATGEPIRDAETLARLASLAVPPAYQEVRYAEDLRGHPQAVGRDEAGRLQYRYHPDWVKVRERRKEQRLLRLVLRLPAIRRALTRHLSAKQPTRAFALAAAVELTSSTAIRAGDEAYARQRGTRGVATLLKSNLKVQGDRIALCFRAKGGKEVRKELRSARLAAAFGRLLKLPGRRLFQYRDEGGGIHPVRRQDINVFLQEIAGARVSLKDFRTLCASALVLETLALATPAASARQRRKQILAAVHEAADSLANTPAICRKSYVHDTVVAAFEQGALEGLSSAVKLSRSPSRREQLVARVLGAKEN